MAIVKAIQVLSAQPWVERLGWTLLHFLWQAALVAALYSIARGSRTPQRRYILACLALAAMVAAPIVTYIAITPASAPANPYVGTIPVSSAVADFAFTPGAPRSPATRAFHDDVMPWLVLAWFAGATVFWVRLTGGWIIATRMRSMLVRPAPREWQRRLDEIGVRIRVLRPVKLIVSAVVQVPTVVGWLRPVVLMPVAALAGLPAERIEALLAHELAHIRRHDYLVNILQSIAEALLFYHPAVWWISNQIRNERELCCDDVAVAISGDALTCVRALAGLESYRPAHFTPALAANGGSLADRISRLLGQSRQPSRIMPGPGILLAALLIAIAAYGLFAQQPAPKQSFEVVSIKPNNLGGGHEEDTGSAGRWVARLTTQYLIRLAFGVNDFQISGGPPWLDQDNYDIVAKLPTPEEPGRKVLQPYLQSLLADRYHLKFHTESREFPGFALVVAKGGPKLTPHTGEPGHHMNSHGDPRKIDLTAVNASLAGLSGYLATQLNQEVVDKTGIAGTFDFKLEWSELDDAGESVPSIFTALQEQLGLKLEARKVPMEVIVVDSVDKPSEN
jgi:uncharacterized protein (TIGR03435 family)